jgi:hypothetical protein
MPVGWPILASQVVKFSIVGFRFREEQHRCSSEVVRPINKFDEISRRIGGRVPDLGGSFELLSHTHTHISRANVPGRVSSYLKLFLVMTFSGK